MFLRASDFPKTRAISRFRLLICLAAFVLALDIFPEHCLIGFYKNPSLAYAYMAFGDVDNDGDIDLDDLQIFSQKNFEQDWDGIDWCLWREQNLEKPRKGDDLLFDFICEIFDCQCGQPPPPNPLPVVNTNDHPLRLVRGGPNQNLYVSNAKTDSIFIYDATLSLTGELRGLNDPLGVAVDSQGRIYVGNDGFDNVEIYDPNGALIQTVGDGDLMMPNDLAFDQSGNLYVVDSERNKVMVYDSNGIFLRSIGAKGDGNGRFRFPCSLLITYPSGGGNGELFVADQGHGLVQVFDLNGNFLRSFGGLPTSGMLGWKTKGKFAKLQSLQIDASGRLHALDSQMCQIQIFDPYTGVYITAYGTRGTGPGQLALPLDMDVDAGGQVAVADYGNNRIEVLSVP